jgi:ribulose 1,5-bisphosphate synthetase/thiazole synthase
MFLNPILFGGVWFIIHRTLSFGGGGWVGGLSQMKLTSFDKKSHILRRSLTSKLFLI